ncbi:MAG: beta-propeller domain-containing protein, partial [Candidatus Hydrogenedentes bacterium]|nr:beta-propeller domain-containing protein [Candidatus Hydrogenedentota bacterium]
MKRTFSHFFIVLLFASLTGCPLLNNINRTFTSADLSGGGVFGTAAEDGGAEAEVGDDGGRDTERTVVEPDVIRREGNLLYILNQYRGLSIVDLDSDILLAQIPTLGSPKDLYFAEGVAYVLVGGIQRTVTEEDFSQAEMGSRVYAVDVANPSEAAIRSELDLSGNLVDSRLVGDILYVVTANYGYYYGPEPISMMQMGDAEEPGSDVSEPVDRMQMGETQVTSIDVSDSGAMVQADQLSFAGTGQVIHVTYEAVFVATSDWSTDETTIVYLDITDPAGTIKEAGTLGVRGYVNDRFKLDSQDGVLRVVSSEWQGTNQVYVSTFDLTDATMPRRAKAM